MVKYLALLVAVLSFNAFGDSARKEFKYGSWLVIEQDNSTHAFTYNKSDETIMLSCGIDEDSDCRIAIFEVGTCDYGSKSHVLFNSDIGAFLAQVDCDKLKDGDSFLKFSKDEMPNIIKALMKSSSLGIAIGMADSTFKVVRFDLKGSTNATQHVIDRKTNYKKADSYSL